PRIARWVLWVAAGDLVDLHHDFLRALDRRPLRQIGRQHEIALVLDRQEAAGMVREAPTRQDEQAGVEQEPDQTGAEQAADHARVEIGAPLERLVEQVEEPAERDVEQPGQRIALRSVLWLE